VKPQAECNKGTRRKKYDGTEDVTLIQKEKNSQFEGTGAKEKTPWQAAAAISKFAQDREMTSDCKDDNTLPVIAGEKDGTELRLTKTPKSSKRKKCWRFFWGMKLTGKNVIWIPCPEKKKKKEHETILANCAGG